MSRIYCTIHQKPHTIKIAKSEECPIDIYHCKECDDYRKEFWAKQDKAQEQK